MTGSLLSVLGLALLDSINPSAIAVTLYLLTQRGANLRVATYIAAIFLTSLMVGVLLMLGLETLMGSFGEALEGIVGSVMLVYSFLVPNNPKSASASPTVRALGGTFLLGVSVTVLEFPTAFPYLGAIGILTRAELGPVGWLPICLSTISFSSGRPFCCCWRTWFLGSGSRHVSLAGKRDYKRKRSRRRSG